MVTICVILQFVITSVGRPKFRFQRLPKPFSPLKNSPLLNSSIGPSLSEIRCANWKCDYPHRLLITIIEYRVFYDRTESIGEVPGGRINALESVEGRKMSSAAIEVQREIAARLEKDGKLCAKGHRSASEQGPHPGYHLWGTKRSRKRTSAPQMGAQPRTALILRSRRSWPVAPVASSRWVKRKRGNVITVLPTSF